LASPETPPTTEDAAPKSWWQDRVKLLLQERARGEFVSWFEPAPDLAKGITNGAEDYAFFANQLRLGVQIKLPHVQLVVEGQDVRLVNLPDDASFAPPIGNLGPGANYFGNSPGLKRDRTSAGETTLRQAYLTLGDIPGLAGLSLTGGRFEYSDGLEAMPADPTLAWVKKWRIGERLIGPFNYTHAGRSFDGVRLVFDHPVVNLTAVAVRPTHGGFELSSSREIGDIGVAGLTATAKQYAGPWLADLRAFYFYYQDERFADRREAPPVPVKVDNRPLAERLNEKAPIKIHTIGMHAATVADLGPGKIDALFWGAVQTGDWGGLSHSGWSYVLEAGYQLPKVPLAPWLRAGFTQASGDGDPNDNVHETFFKMLPTERIYAQTPFFAQSNIQDFFAQLILRPHPKVTIRSDVHWLRLSERKDLWYVGGGANNDDVFGFGGIPSDNHRELSYLADLALNVSITPQLSMYAYYGHAFGQGVVKGTFDGAGADYGYLEATYRY
jgi:Alginate export